MAERRPSLFLPAMVPKGRRCCFKVVSTTFCGGGFSVPSGLVPAPTRLVLPRNNFRPDCFSTPVFGVIFACFRELSLVFNSLPSCL
ncbi:hypothetical protein ZWY2020_009914 [Hordeum vulgare]|nr:hypothetical protein ZWY2020_009914 [Hordeum vulgare]